MKRILLAGFSASLLGAALAVVAAPVAAEAAACSQKTGGGSDSLSWTGKYSGNSEQGYTCAYRYSSGKIKLKPMASKSWTSNTPPGYTKRTVCDKDEKNVQVTNWFEQTKGGSSLTQTGTNWDDGNHRHFGGGVLWSTDEVQGNQFDSEHCNWGDFAVNLYWASKLTLSQPTSAGGYYTFTVTASPQGTKDPVTGPVVIYKQLGDKQDPTKYDANNNPISGTDPIVGQASMSANAATIKTLASPAKYYAVLPGTAVTTVPPVRGWTPSLSTTITVSTAASLSAAKAPVSSAMTVVTRTATAPQVPSVACEAGYRVLQVETGSPTVALDDANVDISNRKAAIAGTFATGTKLTVQAVCIPRNAKPRTLKGLVVGSVKADRLSLDVARGVIMAGPGADRVTVNAGKAVALAGLGDDVISVTGRRAIVNGGPGDDILTSTTRGSARGVLLNAGPGADVLTSGLAGDRLNARDGSGDDRVLCNGTRAVVLADRGDRVMGDCASVKRG